MAEDRKPLDTAPDTTTETPESAPVEAAPVKRPRGFAAMDPERRREIAASGGKAVDPTRRSFSRNPELAVRAGRLGGTAEHRVRRGGRPRIQGNQDNDTHDGGDR